MNDSEKRRWIRATVAAYEGRLVRYARLLTGDTESARDAVQETFLRLWREEQARIEDHLEAWLFRVCRHRALDTRRKEGRMVSLDDSPRPESPSVGADPAGPAGRLEREQSLGRVLVALAELTPLQQEVLRLRFQEELSYKQISSVTGRSVSHVGVLIHEGVKRLRQKLDGVPNGKGGR